MNNSLNLSNWPLNKLCMFIFIIQIGLLSVIFFDSININLPLIRESLSFIYLLFIPGILILRILKIDNLEFLEWFLYTIGLSIFCIMFTGFLINLIYPQIGIIHPISILPLIITFFLLILILLILCYFTEKNYKHKIQKCTFNLNDYTSNTMLFIYLIPFLAIIGTYLMNNFGINILNFLVILILSIITILISFNKIKKSAYPLVIFITSISLLYLTSLISNNIWGWDIQLEYYYADMVLKNSYWYFKLNSNYNSMLSIVMFSPIYSIISNMNLTFIFKIIYPFIFSMVPLGLYQIFKKQTSAKIAFMGVFYFIATFTFYGEMLHLARQQIAELFLVLMILLLLNENINKSKISLLNIAFAISLIVSHYGLSYLYIICFFLILAVSYVLKLINFNKDSGPKKFSNIFSVLSPNFILLFISFSLFWYIYMSNASIFSTIINIGNQITSSFLNDLMNPDATQGLQIISDNFLPLHQITKFLHIISQLLISVGLLYVITHFKKFSFKKEYLYLSLAFLILLIFSIIIPNFSKQLQTTRIYHIALITLSPFFVVGFITFYKFITKKINKNLFNSDPIKLIAIFLSIFLLFNSGAIYDIGDEKSGAASLIVYDQNFDYPKFSDIEVTGAQWLLLKNENKKVYADQYRWLLLSRFFDPDKIDYLTLYNLDILTNPDKNESAIIYLGNLNVKKNMIFIPYSKQSYKQINQNFLENEIYQNGESSIYFMV